MATYSYSRSIYDLNSFVSYVSATLPIQKATFDGTNVVASFATALSAPNQTLLANLVAAYPNPNLAPIQPNALSVLNTTSSALAANGVFTGLWEEVGRYSSISISVLSNVASAANGLSVQFGMTSQQADRTRAYTVAAATAAVHLVATAERWFRIVYTNGSTIQTSFQLQAIFRESGFPGTVSGSDTIDDTYDGLLARSIGLGKTDRGQYGTVGVDENASLRVDVGKAMYDRNRSVRQVPTVCGRFAYNLINADVFNTVLTGSGTATAAGGLAVLSTSATASSSATLTTKRRVRTRPGQSAMVVIAAQFTTGVANSTQLVGVGDAQNGLFFGYNGATFGVLRRIAATDAWTAATSFNIDKLDGGGPSGMTLVPNRGQVYSITFDGTGFGGVTFSVQSDQGSQDLVACHRISVANNATVALNVNNATLPIIASAVNTTNATALTVSLAGFGGFSDGDLGLLGNKRAVEGSVAINTIAYAPVLTLSNKTTFNSITNNSVVQVESLCISCDGNRNVTVALVEGATLSSASYTDVNTSTSVVAFDTAATTYSSGQVIFATTVYQKGQVVLDVREFNLVVHPGNTLTVVAKGISGGIFTTQLQVCVNFSEETV